MHSAAENVNLSQVNNQLSFSFPDPSAPRPVPQSRRNRGRRSYLAGHAAEHAVHRLYERRGLKMAARRWRGGGGEIDLIYRDGDACVFVEVKQSSSFDRAAQSLRPAQIRRILQAASVFVGNEPNGQMTEMRFDVALVNGQGETEIIENALMAA